MFSKIKLGIYYLIISKLPHSRMGGAHTALRRWYVSKVMGILAAGPDSFFGRNVYLADATKVRIGRYCHVNEDVFIQGASIGDSVVIGRAVAILSTSGRRVRSATVTATPTDISPSKPVIEDDVWIGCGAVILPGVRVGKGSMVGAGAIVMNDVPPHSIVSGAPARIIRKRPNGWQTPIRVAA